MPENIEIMCHANSATIVLRVPLHAQPFSRFVSMRLALLLAEELPVGTLASTEKVDYIGFKVMV